MLEDFDFHELLGALNLACGTGKADLELLQTVRELVETLAIPSSCFDCSLAVFEPGTPGTYTDPPEPPTAWCTKGYDEGSFSEEEAALKCGHFDPVLVEECANCGRHIGIPARAWKIWAFGYENYACCSIACRELYQAELDRVMLP